MGEKAYMLWFLAMLVTLGGAVWCTYVFIPSEESLRSESTGASQDEIENLQAQYREKTQVAQGYIDEANQKRLVLASRELELEFKQLVSKRDNEHQRTRLEKDRKIAFPEIVYPLLRKFNNYSFKLSKQLTTMVSKGKLRPVDREIILMKILREIDVFRKLCFKNRSLFISEGEGAFLNSVKPLEKALDALQEWHEDFIGVLIKINGVQLSDAHEELRRKRRAEEEYNFNRSDESQAFSEIEQLMYNRIQEHDLTESQVEQGAEEYYEA